MSLREIGVWIHSIKFLSLAVVLCLYKFTIRQCMEYCCHVLAGAQKRYLDIVNRFQERACRAELVPLPLTHFAAALDCKILYLQISFL